MSKRTLTPYKVASSQSLSASFNSAPTIVTYQDNCAYQINITTTNSQGTFYVQGSVDYQVDATTNTVTNAGNWIDLTLAGGNPTAAAANDNILITLNQLPFNAIRIRYLSSVAGTGTCDIWIQLKNVGA